MTTLISPDLITNGLTGFSVEPGKIDKELKKLWSDSDGVATRASLMNLAIYTEDPNGLETESAFISEITRTHACRAILINARPEAPETKVESWINVHCHVTGAGAKQVCCEQISFLLEGAATQRIANVVFSHLDSDLPLTFVWRGNLHKFPDNRFWTWVDKLIVDSLNWEDPKANFEMLQEVHRSAPRLCLRDLNWMRSVYLRGALTQSFDHPSARRMLARLEDIEIHHSPGRRITALLVIGWMSSRLGWKEVRRDGENYVASPGPDAPEIHIRLVPASGEGFSRMSLTAASGDAQIHISREQGAAHYLTQLTLPGEGTTQRLLPAGTRGVPALVIEELARGSRSRNCEIALETILELL